MREVSSPDLLTPDQQKARDAEIQQLKAEYEALERVTDSLITQSMKLNDKNRLAIIPKQDAILAELSAVRADTSISAAENESPELTPETAAKQVYGESVDESGRETQRL